MPIYEYECNECKSHYDYRISFSDNTSADGIVECEKCGGELRRIFSQVCVIFKGRGFYVNERRGTENEIKD